MAKSFLSQLIYCRSFWLTLFVVTVYFYCSKFQLNLNIHVDYFIGIYWILLQSILIEISILWYSHIPKKDIIPSNVFHTLVILLFHAIISGSVSIDLLSTNKTSHIYITNNIFTSKQCDDIIKISEDYVHNHLNSLLLDNQGSSQTTWWNYIKQNKLTKNRIKLMNTNGWLTERNYYNYETTDISLLSINTIYKYAYYNKTTNIYQYTNDNFNSWIKNNIYTKLFPLIIKQYNLPYTDIFYTPNILNNVYIVKYSSNIGRNNVVQQTAMKLHRDASDISFVIALSSQYTFEEYKHIQSTNTQKLYNFKLEHFKKYGNLDHYTDEAYVHTGTTQYVGGGTYLERAKKTIHLQKGAMLSHPSKLFHSGEAITAGERYLLVGFVSVPRYHISTIARRYGAFTQCVQVHPERDYKEVVVESSKEVRDTCTSDEKNVCSAASSTISYNDEEGEHICEDYYNVWLEELSMLLTMTLDYAVQNPISVVFYTFIVSIGVIELISGIVILLHSLEDNGLVSADTPEGTKFYHNAPVLDDNVRNFYENKIRKRSLMIQIRKLTAKRRIIQEYNVNKVRTIDGVRTYNEIFMVNHMKTYVKVRTIDGIRTHIELAIQENKEYGVNFIDIADGVRTMKDDRVQYTLDTVGVHINGVHVETKIFKVEGVRTLLQIPTATIPVQFQDNYESITIAADSLKEVVATAEVHTQSTSTTNTSSSTSSSIMAATGKENNTGTSEDVTCTTTTGASRANTVVSPTPTTNSCDSNGKRELC